MTVAVPWRLWTRPRAEWISLLALSRALGLLGSRSPVEDAKLLRRERAVSPLDSVGEATDAAWQYLGPMLGGYMYFFAPTTNGGILWAYTGGTFVGRLGGYEALPGLFSTATYP